MTKVVHSKVEFVALSCPSCAQRGTDHPCSKHKKLYTSRWALLRNRLCKLLDAV
eukprot:CAMPEP_0114242148 /NCGR_PEP_ID=MMETSP0058-20121206/10011_1 /TAXON_ID=36894 /ORGANISM="Pyramimonas parkeae, CCMP726" /LENGTH=53 /DNA_ID=CAMNT_0001354721 /DNA_START=671 /DNA_END=832 /DNA_ORIENTATION=+